MLPRTVVTLLLALLSWQCFAASPIATVSSTQSIVVSGITVPTNRVISWPVALNDEIVTQSAPAMVRFADGTVVTLQRNSRMLLKQGAAGVEVNMLAGSAIYDLKPNSNVSIPNVAAAGGSTGQKAARKGSSANETTAMALAQRGSSTGVALAPATTGTLVADARAGSAALASGQFHSNARTLAPGPIQVVLPDGQTILTVHLVGGGGPTQSSTYVIDKITFTVPDTSRPGSSIYLTTPTNYSSPLIGAEFLAPSGPFGGTIPLNVFLVNGTPLTPGQFTNYLQQAANAAYSDPKNYLPDGTTQPTYPSPITQGTLSTP